MNDVVNMLHASSEHAKCRGFREQRRHGDARATYSCMYTHGHITLARDLKQNINV